MTDLIVSAPGEQQAGTETVSPARRQHITDQSMRSAALKAELSSVLADIQNMLGYTETVTSNLSLTLDPANPETDWLPRTDSQLFHQTLGEAQHAVDIAAAINRSHPGTPMWPQLMDGDAASRTEYVVQYTMPDGSEGFVTGHGLYGFPTVRDAQTKAKTLLAAGCVAQAQVKARQHHVSAVGDVPEDDADA